MPAYHGGVKVFLYALLRALILVGVAALVYFVFGWYRFELLGAIGAGLVGAAVAFAVGYLLFDRQRRAAAESFGEVMARRQRPASRAEEEAEIEDAFQDQEARRVAEERAASDADGDPAAAAARARRLADERADDAG